MTNGLPIARSETRLRFSGFTANIGDLKALPELAERLGMALRKHTKSPTNSPLKRLVSGRGCFSSWGEGLYHDYTMIIPWLYHDYTMIIPWLYHDYTMIIPWLYHVFFLCWKLLISIKKITSHPGSSPRCGHKMGCPLPLGWDGARLVIQKKMEEQLKYT